MQSMRVNKPQGFTLVELLTTILILGIFATAVVPIFSSNNQQKLEIATTDLKNALRYARSQAINKRSPYGVRLQTDTKLLQVFRLDTATVPPTEVFDVYHPVDKQLYARNLDAISFTRGASYSANFQYQGSATVYWTIAFDAYGEPISPASLLPLTSGAITVTHDSQVRTVTVVPVLGRIKVS